MTTQSPDEKLKEILCTAIGEFSGICMRENPKWVFPSEKALEIANKYAKQIAQERASKQSANAVVLPDEKEAFDIAHGIGQKLFIDMRKAANDPQKNELIAIHAAGATAMYRYLLARLNAPTVCEGKCEPDAVWEGPLLCQDWYKKCLFELEPTNKYKVLFYKLPESGTGGK